jgi:hypothetical protein
MILDDRRLTVSIKYHSDHTFREASKDQNNYGYQKSSGKKGSCKEGDS